MVWVSHCAFSGCHLFFDFVHLLVFSCIYLQHSTETDWFCALTFSPEIRSLWCTGYDCKVAISSSIYCRVCLQNVTMRCHWIAHVDSYRSIRTDVQEWEMLPHRTGHFIHIIYMQHLGPAKTACTILGRLVIVCAQKNTVSWTPDKPSPEGVGGEGISCIKWGLIRVVKFWRSQLNLSTNS